MEMKISFGDQTLVYRKRTWAIPMDDGSVDERGIRYGENPDQEAALYELVNGNLYLATANSSNRVTAWFQPYRWKICCRLESTQARST